MNADRLMLLGHVSATWFMTGLIWFVQIVHYPLMRHVGNAEFVNYERLHSRFTTWVVGPAMLVEVATLAWLLHFHPRDSSRFCLVASAVLLAIIWLSTQFIQVPCHDALCRQWDSAIHARLVHSNWIRTVTWSVRGLLVLVFASQRWTTQN